MAFDAEGAYQLHPQVALRPEPFGALAYHYGNRRLVFLKTAAMVDVVNALGSHVSARAALIARGVPASKHENYLKALADLERSEIIRAATC